MVRLLGVERWDGWIGAFLDSGEVQQRDWYVLVVSTPPP